MGTNSVNGQFVKLLIEKYRALPSLWEVDSDAYKNKSIKNKDYTTLLNIMSSMDPSLTMEELKKKIASVRTCYRRELKKVSESIKSGATGDKVYVPTLWYFDEVDFLRDQEPRAALNRLTLVVDDIKPEHNLVQRKIKTKTRTIPYRPHRMRKKIFQNKSLIRSDNIQQNQIENKIQQNRTEKDEADTFSETWAILFRKLSHEQQLFGKRCIDEILYQGQLGTLNASTYRNIEASNNTGSIDFGKE